MEKLIGILMVFIFLAFMAGCGSTLPEDEARSVISEHAHDESEGDDEHDEDGDEHDEDGDEHDEDGDEHDE